MQFFEKTDKGMIKKKFAYFLAYATGGPIDWVGKTIP